MKVPRILLRTAWITAEVTVTAAWALIMLWTGIQLLQAYGGEPGYTGQVEDQQFAWQLLMVLAALSVIVALGVVWPLIRWLKRRARATSMRSRAGG